MVSVSLEETWGGGNKPSKWNPLAFTIKKKYVGITMREGKLSYFINQSKDAYEEGLRTYTKGYMFITFDDFMNDSQEIENEMDISFLYG